MKLVVRNLLQKFGLSISRTQKSPYDYLKEFPRYKEATVSLLDKKFKIADSASYYWSYKEIFTDHIYNFNCDKKEPVIIDCGSNYGTSIVYFKSLYPNAKITAVEADPTIFQLLEWNINQRHYNDVILINKAVSAKAGSIAFYHEGADAGRTFPIVGNEKSEEVVDIATIHIDDLIQEPVDFLKMDIEGSETGVICSSKKLKDVAQLFIEYHSFQKSEQTLGKILESLSFNGFRYYIHTQFCSPRPFIEPALQLGMDLQLNIFATRYP